MMLTSEDIRLIDLYLDNELTSEDQIALNKRLNDSEFLEEVQVRSLIVQKIRSQSKATLKKELKAQLQTKRKLNFVNQYQIRFFLYAAAVVTLVGLSFLFYQNSNNAISSTDELYLAYYKPFSTVTTRGSSENQMKAFEKYNSGDYVQAQELFNKLLVEKASDFDKNLIYLLLGNCYLNMEQVDKAADSFKLLINDVPSDLTFHAEWYYSLTLLKQGKKVEALKMFDKISDSQSPYSDLGKQLSSKLKVK